MPCVITYFLLNELVKHFEIKNFNQGRPVIYMASLNEEMGQNLCVANRRNLTLPEIARGVNRILPWCIKVSVNLVSRFPFGKPVTPTVWTTAPTVWTNVVLNRPFQMTAINVLASINSVTFTVKLCIDFLAKLTFYTCLGIAMIVLE